MTVREVPVHANNKNKTVAPRTPPNIGFLRPAHIERWFVGLLYLTMFALVLLSVIGTFYGWKGQQAPLTAPGQILTDMTAGGPQLWYALIIQGALSLAQYGARQFAQSDRRWWFLYLLALGVSVYYNVQAYWIPLGELVAWYVAAFLIVAGDVLPEFLAVRHE